MMTSSLTGAQLAARDFPFWLRGDRANEASRHATWRDQDKAKPRKVKVETTDDER